jgi:hypothetical protein
MFRLFQKCSPHPQPACPIQSAGKRKVGQLNHFQRSVKINLFLFYDQRPLQHLGPLTVTTGNCPGSTGFCGHVFSSGYELKNDLGSGSGKASEDISVIPELENSWIIS